MILDIINEPSRVWIHSRPSISVLLFGGLLDITEGELKLVGLSTSTALSRLAFLQLFIFLFSFPEHSLLPHLVLLLPWSMAGMWSCRVRSPGCPQLLFCCTCVRVGNMVKTCHTDKAYDLKVWGKGGAAHCTSREGDKGFKWEMWHSRLYRALPHAHSVHLTKKSSPRTKCLLVWDEKPRIWVIKMALGILTPLKVLISGVDA